MAKYEINHTCGHTETVQLYGNHTERERKIEWLESQECPACRRKKELEEAEKINSGLELPELEGSEKQIAWATTIRAKIVQFIKDHTTPETIKDSQAFKTLQEIRSAHYFIEHRDESAIDFLTNYFNAQQEQKEEPVKEEPPTEKKAPAKKEPTWRKIAVNVQNIAHTTEKAALIKLPHSSKHDGFQVWVSLKLLREGRHSYEYLLSAKSDMEFTLKKYGQGKWNKSEVLAEKTISAEEMAEAFGGWADNAPRYSEPAIDPDKEEIVKHVPAPLEAVKIEADPELVR